MNKRRTQTKVTALENRWGSRSVSNAWLCLFCGLLLLTLSGCADSLTFEQAASREPVGFWYGLWHGLILPISFIVSLFSDSTAIYATYNNGGWYDFGFVLGVSSSLGGSASSASRSKA